MFGSYQEDSVGRLGDQALAELVGTDPADWEPAVDTSLDRWDEALTALVLASIDEADELAANPLAHLSDREVVELAGRAERDLRRATALGYRVAAELARRRPDPSGDPDERGLSAYAIDEIALSTGLARGVVSGRVAEADALTGRHPLLLSALSAGLFPLPAVRKVLETTVLLDVAQCAEVEVRLLDRLGRADRLALGSMSEAQLQSLPTAAVVAVSSRATTARVGSITRDLVHRIDPLAAAKREARAKTQRGVGVEPGTNGMAWLGINVPVAMALASYERIDSLARAIPADPDDDRSLDAKRADVAVDLLLKAPADAPFSPVNVQVVVDHTGCDLSSPGHGGLIGSAGRLGAVTVETVRELLDVADRTKGTIEAAPAIREPCPGQDVHDADGPGRYEPSDRLRRSLQVRDRRCVFPGCNRPARTCELDHSLRYPAGPTCSCNLGHLCVHHHHLKHLAPGWILDNHGEGRFTWTTPTGMTFDVTPDRDRPDDDPDPPPT
jgi:hypothetical protein